jgi:hypothetical protein
VRTTLFTEVPALEAVLSAHQSALADDFTAYRNHTYRVVNLCVALAPDGASRMEKIAIAAAFHDLGIWTDGTFDYLQPSVRLASAYLAHEARQRWVPEITSMILEHHKISRYRGAVSPLVEPFRQADWIDVSRGLVRFGLSRARLNDIFSAWPSAGFHNRLLQLSCRRLLTHPLNPLPMLRL